MTEDAKSTDLSHKKHDLKITCKRFENWGMPTFREVARAVYRGFLTSVYLGVCGELVVMDFCLICSVPKPSPQSQFLSLCGGYKPLAESFLTKGISQKVQNFAIMTGCNKTISSVMKIIRGKEDVHTCLVAGFSYGVAISLVTGMRGCSVILVGVISAVLNAGNFMVDCAMGLTSYDEMSMKQKEAGEDRP